MQPGKDPNRCVGGILMGMRGAIGPGRGEEDVQIKGTAAANRN